MRVLRKLLAVLLVSCLGLAAGIASIEPVPESEQAALALRSINDWQGSPPSSRSIREVFMRLVSTRIHRRDTFSISAKNGQGSGARLDFTGIMDK